MTLRLTPAQYAAVRQPRPAPRETRPRKAPRREEAATLRACLALLKLCCPLAWRANAGGGMRRGGGGRMVPVVGNPAGTSDLIAVLPGGGGRLLACEVKSRAGKLRPAQRAFLDAVTAAGGLACVVRSLGDLRAVLAAEGVTE